MDVRWRDIIKMKLSALNLIINKRSEIPKKKLMAFVYFSMIKLERTSRRSEQEEEIFKVAILDAMMCSSQFI
jgi:hypothetical protein